MTPFPYNSTTWTPLVRFTVPGPPVPKERPRFSIRKGRPHTRTADKTRTYEDKVRIFARSAMAGIPVVPKGIPVRVDLLLVHEMPKTRSKRISTPGPFYKATKTGGDGDNILKSITDALNGIVYVDDGQVSTHRVDAIEVTDFEKSRAVVLVCVPRAWLQNTVEGVQ